MSLDLFIKNRKIICVKSHTYYKDKSVYPEVVVRFSSPEVPALDPESKWSLSKYGLASSCQFITICHTYKIVLFFLSPQTSHKVTFPQAYGSSILKPACSQGAFVERVYSEFLLLPHPLLQERQL